MIYFNNNQLDNYFQLHEVQYNKVFLYQKSINEDKKNNEMESGRTLKIILYKRKYREDLENYLKYKMGILNTIFTTNAFWLQTNKKDYFYGYFTDIKEEIKSDYTAFLTLTFTSLYPFSFTYTNVQNKKLYYTASETNNPSIDFLGNTLVYASFTNTSTILVAGTEIPVGGYIKATSTNEIGYLVSSNRAIINRKSCSMPNFYYYTCLKLIYPFTEGSFTIQNADCFTVQNTILNEGKNK